MTTSGLPFFVLGLLWGAMDFALVHRVMSEPRVTPRSATSWRSCSSIWRRPRAFARRCQGLLPTTTASTW